MASFFVSEIAKHNTPEDAWLVIDENVYDVTRFLERHPGGRVIETQLGAPDATDAFRAFHHDKVRKWLRTYFIGTRTWDKLPNKKAQTATQAYRQIEKTIQERGWYRASLTYFVLKAVVALGFMAASLSILLVWPSPPLWLASVAGLLAAGFLQQSALLGHDLGHNGVFESFKTNNRLALLAGVVCFGFNSEQWKDEHNVHHAITNRVHQDLQFVYLPVWLLDQKELRDYTMPWYARLFVRVQLFTFLPLSVLVGRINLMVLTIIYSVGFDTKRESRVKVSPAQLVGLLLHYTWQGLLLAFLLSTTAQRLVFVATMYWAAGILHIQLTLSHVGTEMFFADDQHALEFVQFQLHSTRNIDASWATHWFHGGLEFQIEHHLFPRLPRHRLQDVKPLVQALAIEHDLPYTSTGFVDATLDVLKHMHRTSKLVE